MAHESGGNQRSAEHPLSFPRQIFLSPDSNHRRKSSLVSSEDPRIDQRRTDSYDRNTACFVHSLLNGEWVAPAETLEDIDSSVREKGLVSGESRPEDNDSLSVVDHASRLPEQGAPAVVHSRHLTKRQLSDMAWNVRRLSKRLGSIKLRLTVKTVFLVTKVHDVSLIKLTREVTQWLLSKDRYTKYTVYVEDRLKDHPDFNAAGLIEEEPSAAGRLKYWDTKLASEHPQMFDFVVTLGGDGTVLYTSWLFQRIVPPVLSFSLGSLGFLTKFDFNNYQEILTNAFRDGVVVSLRLRFECTVMRSNPQRKEGEPGTKRDLVEELIGEEVGDSLTHTPDKVFEILNDVVVDRGPNPTMSSIELFGDDEHFTTVLADGVCISTPTGSTAYNLAAGGSLSHPENPVILVTAICAHTLSFRPIILPDTMVLRMGVPYDARTTSWASFDGRERVELHPGDYVTVSASRYPFAYVLPPGRRSEDWVQSISKTLNWNSRQRQKGFR
ncbi:NAD+ kinase [Rasamsonia emersonii CBS 393.64]|uniref:NAD+ kinase n=1 Tax=Rasamsonia emersonii (strain ATCC 16479 / CBS 393.64 / IMI 116815) TaxID=1408163 RepID=A0A0F4YYQ1_RASE3|nr:NAD+ kinase [Rasamsonia emersonii CBS 393.64]KKA22748.1 NAD+ kinase [Rasamsonia emersonii CBS 393.64]